jgi:queuosine precursor transporter
MTRQQTQRGYRYYDVVMAGFVTVLLCADLIGPAKIAQLQIPPIGPVTFGAGVVFFPISYLFGDILTEVYGYARARKVVWTGFAALIFASFMSWVVVLLPPAPDWGNQHTYSTVFGQVPRIVLASLLGFWAGEFTNSYVLAKMKIWSAGRWLWTRTIGSTIAGEIVDSLIFYNLAFAGIWSSDQILRVMVTNYLIKCGWEILATPVTYLVVNWLKRVEHEDFFDRSTDFNPFHFDPKPPH